MPGTDYHTQFKYAPAALICGGFMLAALLAACGEASGPDTGKGYGQTIARVNGQEITMHELETELKALGPIKPEDRPAAARQALRRIVERTVLAQKAAAMKLDRTPEVMTQLRRKQAQVLARAYIAATLARQMPISKYDIADFIEQHPNYFSGRKYYVFDQVLIPKGQATDDVVAAIKDLTTLEQVESVLKKMHVDYSRQLRSNVGNQFTREEVKKMNALDPEELFLVRAKDYAVISRIVASRPDPVSGQQARDAAKRRLLSRRNQAAMRKTVGNLVAQAELKFMGKFADMQMSAAESVGGKYAASKAGGTP